MITTTLKKFSTILPQPHLDTWNQLLAHTINNPNPVMICLAGKCGLGKTSLMNMLLGDPVLPTGKDSIQIPVHVLPGEAFDVRLTDASGQKRGLDTGNLPKALASVQDASAHLEISAPLEWLRGAVIVDVPDLEAITSRYFQQADAFVYLIDSGGPNEADIRFIQAAIAAGQQVMVAAAQWDIVEERMKQGFMTMPDIQAWEEHLQQVTGKEIYVTPVSRAGTGTFALATYFQNVVRSREVLRKERLLNVGLPILFDIFEEAMLRDIKYALHIKTDPVDAKVSILDPEMAYSTGMKVKPGKYQVKVEMAGYHTKEQWLEVTNRDVETSIVLSKTVVQSHPRYAKLGHGGIELSDDATQAQGWLMTRDKHTGLIWELKTSANKGDKYTLNEAKTVFIRQLNNQFFGGFNDWRLPTKDELKTLIKHGSMPAIDAEWLPCTESSGYWSATTNATIMNHAWLVLFNNGFVRSNIKSGSYYVRAVRAGR